MTQTNEDDIVVPSREGPPIYENWKSALQGEDAFGAQEFPLFTDAHIMGQIVEGYGPYQLLNTIPRDDEYQVLRPAVILRVDYHKEYNPTHPMNRTDDERYHGGALQDEVAALVSLCLGIRLKAGGATRSFELDKDPRGTPETFGAYKDPVLTRGFEGKIVPRAVGTHSLERTAPFTILPTLLPQNIIALVRAARQYQDGLWIAESQPELSWLLFVSAIETAANHWRAATESPLDRLRASRPELETLLRAAGGEALLLQVAEQLAPYMGSTKKFGDFILEFLPEAPQERPVKFAQHPWTKKAMQQTMRRIYQYRSRALHGGIPFPAPMCEPPRKSGEHGELTEVLEFEAMRTRGGTWIAKDTPMLLHTFEYIVRGALLKWWTSMTPNNP